MASKHMHVILVAIVFVLPAIALAKEFVVGDGAGWTINFDYRVWAAGKDFRVGDTIVFKYPIGAHNVFKVNGTGFQDCIVPPLNQALVTGNDVITLSTPGRKWYICGVAKHCANGGQKLAITVQSDLLAPSLAPTGWNPSTGAEASSSANGVHPSTGAEASSSANGIVASGYQALMVGAITVAAMMIMV